MPTLQQEMDFGRPSAAWSGRLWRTLEVLSEDRKSIPDWQLLELLLRTAMKGTPSYQPPEHPEYLLYIRSPQEQERFSRALGLWQPYPLEGLDASGLDASVTQVVAEWLRPLRPDLTVFSQEVAGAVAQLLAPEAGASVLAYGAGAGEVVGALGRTNASSPFHVLVVDRRTSLHALVRCRRLLNPKASYTVEFAPALGGTSHEVDRIYGCMIDSQHDDLDHRDRVEKDQELIASLSESLSPRGRVVLAVPEVYLNGSTVRQLRDAISGMFTLRAVAQLPVAALALGSSRCGLLVLDCWGAPDAPVTMGLVRNPSVKRREDLQTFVQSVLGRGTEPAAARGNTWVDDPSLERWDPAFYRKESESGAPGELASAPRRLLGDLVERWVRGGRLPEGIREPACLPKLIGTTGIKDLRIESRPDTTSHNTTCRVGDVVITVKSVVGNTAVVPRPLDGAKLGSGVVALRLRPLVDPVYLAVFLQSDSGQKALGRITKGTGSRFIPVEDLLGLQIPVPDRSKQAEIARRVGLLYETAAKLRRQADECVKTASNALR